jgi:hypothetical protein
VVDKYPYPVALGEAVQQAQEAAAYAEDRFASVAFKEVLRFLLHRLEEEED